jgi:hypothetical protein
LWVYTVGGVLAPGEQIMLIVPEGDNLRAEVASKQTISLGRITGDPRVKNHAALFVVTPGWDALRASGN